jgi:hypothetical protein
MFCQLFTTTLNLINRGPSQYDSCCGRLENLVTECARLGRFTVTDGEAGRTSGTGLGAHHQGQASLCINHRR